MAWEPDRRYNFFFSPPAHLCAVTYMTEISLIVTLNNQFTGITIDLFVVHYVTVLPRDLVFVHWFHRSCWCSLSCHTAQSSCVSTLVPSFTLLFIMLPYCVELLCCYTGSIELFVVHLVNGRFRATNTARSSDNKSTVITTRPLLA